MPVSVGTGTSSNRDLIHCRLPGISTLGRFSRRDVLPPGRQCLNGQPRDSNGGRPSGSQKVPPNICGGQCRRNRLPWTIDS
ncbi:hypothetical protein FA15DRAFT_675724 [Coprinopsis marcescibilis]|uniref:Uncharacterized protein n=1 Tax=Coprinopsis marcescibilis TaxID=230819 RepID=A0A5C3KCV7_COPMA|nr:hypothetical protein FA15DRAFT_675724 [Coprinopsis marcescibilis]